MPIDLKRRKAVMARSVKLGHCICNPKQACPCFTFKEFNICTCAGEKLPVKTKDISLTQYVRKAGCASKIGQVDLMRILKKLPPVTDPNVLLGTAAGDDAGVYRIDDQYALVQTVDVFSPCVDNAYLFGQIAAANSVSDIYAMGGKPITALSIIGFPIEKLDGSIMEEILRGGIDKLQEADCSLIGGHSINDEEIKCGFAITGLIDAKKTVEQDKVCPGDVLVLTKPLGTGIVCFAAQIGRISEESLNEVGASMATLNRDAAELMVKYRAHACTDVTGFGLAGHLVEMVQKSGIAAEIDMSALPVFGIVEECLKNDILPGAIERNQEYSMAWVKVEDTGSKENLPILYDPQTSGGLLISMPEKMAQSFVKEMKKRGHESTSIIGRIVKQDKDYSECRIIVFNTRLQNFIGTKEGLIMGEKKKNAVSSQSEESVSTPATEEEHSCCDNPVEESCCESPPSVAEEGSENPLSLFKDFLKQVNKEGLIDKRTKQLIAISLSVVQCCRPCFFAHVKSAVSSGISKAEIEEAANLAISFAGCPAMMFYEEVCKEI